MTITPENPGRTLERILAEPAPVPAPPRPSSPQPPDGPDRRPARAKPRLRALDGLRLVAALMVAAYHYGGRGGDITKAWGTSAASLVPTAHT
ncbi:acyltransferase, partial [Streptomyces sp. NPDC059744]